MSLKIEIKPENLSRMNKAYDKSPDVVNDYLQKAIDAVLPEVKSKIRARTPVITGRLKGGVEITKRPTIKSLIGIVSSTVEYGPYVHARKPFMTLGVEDSRELILKRFEEAMNNIKEELSF